MQKIKIILIVFAFASCVAYEADIKEVTPDRATGCGEYEGERWEDCMISQVDRWERIENAPLVKTVLSRNRIGWSEMVKEHIKVCRATLCSEFYETRKSPAWYHDLAQNAVVGGIAAIGGYLAGKAGFIFLML